MPVQDTGQLHPEKITRTSAQTKPVRQVATVLDAGLMWQVIQGIRDGNRACHRKKAVGEPYEGKPHVRFEVAGDGNQDMSQAPSPDPTRGPGFARGKRRAKKQLSLVIHLLNPTQPTRSLNSTC